MLSDGSSPGQAQHQPANYKLWSQLSAPVVALVLASLLTHFPPPHVQDTWKEESV